MNSLDAVISETLHGEGKINKISEKTGMSKSTLYRYGLPPQTSGLDIPLRKLAPILRAAGDYRILHKIAAECGFLCVREPRVACLRRDREELIGELQKNAANAVLCAIVFFDRPGNSTFQNSIEALDNTQRSAVGVKRVVQRRGQLELNFN